MIGDMIKLVLTTRVPYRSHDSVRKEGLRELYALQGRLLQIRELIDSLEEK